MVERRVVFDVKVDMQEGEAGENIARAALILMARSLLKADEDLEAAAEADGWKFHVEAAPASDVHAVLRPAFDSDWGTGNIYCPYPGTPMPIIEPNNGGMGTSGWPKWPPVGTVVWARQGSTEMGELFAYDGEGWKGLTPRQYAEQQTLLESEVQKQRVAYQNQYSRSAARSRTSVASTMASWAARLGKDPSDWDAVPPTT